MTLSYSTGACRPCKVRKNAVSFSHWRHGSQRDCSSSGKRQSSPTAWSKDTAGCVQRRNSAKAPITDICTACAPASSGVGQVGNLNFPEAFLTTCFFFGGGPTPRDEARTSTVQAPSTPLVPRLGPSSSTTGASFWSCRDHTPL